ncbi:MAG TPA: hypothetical protein VFT67_09135 [Jatrophihabitantaceae bacterium]|nr:hypothetical protein [Jatrophihabitantaceae bacterium]
MSEPTPDALRAALKRTASALKQVGLPFALTGSYALWARGGPESQHDVDFMIAEQDVDAIASGLAAEGLTARRPPEDWLLKLETDGVVVDLLHRAGGVPVDATMFDSAEVLEVLSVRMPVLPATEVMVHKLGALSDHYCDFAPLLASVRAVREQLDWARLRERTAGNDHAAAFLFLADRLGLTA